MSASDELSQSKVDPVFLGPEAFAILGKPAQTMKTKLRMKVNNDKEKRGLNNF